MAAYEKAIQTGVRRGRRRARPRARRWPSSARRRTRLVVALEETLRLSEERYRAGIDGYLGVLVAQQALFARAAGERPAPPGRAGQPDRPLQGARRRGLSGGCGADSARSRPPPGERGPVSRRRDRDGAGGRRGGRGRSPCRGGVAGAGRSGGRGRKTCRGGAAGAGHSCGRRRAGRSGAGRRSDGRGLRRATGSRSGSSGSRPGNGRTSRPGGRTPSRPRSAAGARGRRTGGRRSRCRGGRRRCRRPRPGSGRCGARGGEGGSTRGRRRRPF